ncbi:MAG: hypothetical protein IKA04_06760 [Alistipes sp.]|nr:hypothetical protein [Alistipes sp.]
MAITHHADKSAEAQQADRASSGQKKNRRTYVQRFCAQDETRTHTG